MTIVSRRRIVLGAIGIGVALIPLAVAPVLAGPAPAVSHITSVSAR
jgi:hypothetical protein